MKTNVLGLTFATVVFVIIPALLIEVNGLLNIPTVSYWASRFAGITLFAIGIILFTYFFTRFRLTAKGTPVPTRPPQILVTDGIFRYSRNPIYLSHLLILTGTGLFLGLATILGYAIIYMFCIEFDIKSIEEPELRNRFGDQYENYCNNTPRWILR